MTANVATRAAFARLLVAHGLGDRGDVTFTSRYLATYGSEVKHDTTREDGVLYVGSMHGVRDWVAVPPVQG